MNLRINSTNLSYQTAITSLRKISGDINKPDGLPGQRLSSNNAEESDIKNSELNTSKDNSSIRNETGRTVYSTDGDILQISPGALNAHEQLNQFQKEVPKEIVYQDKFIRDFMHMSNNVIESDQAFTNGGLNDTGCKDINEFGAGTGGNGNWMEDSNNGFNDGFNNFENGFSSGYGNIDGYYTDYLNRGEAQQANTITAGTEQTDYATASSYTQGPSQTGGIGQSNAVNGGWSGYLDSSTGISYEGDATKTTNGDKWETRGYDNFTDGNGTNMHIDYYRNSEGESQSTRTVTDKDGNILSEETESNGEYNINTNKDADEYRQELSDTEQTDNAEGTDDAGGTGETEGTGGTGETEETEETEGSSEANTPKPENPSGQNVMAAGIPEFDDGRGDGDSGFFNGDEIGRGGITRTGRGSSKGGRSRFVNDMDPRRVEKDVGAVVYKTGVGIDTLRTNDINFRSSVASSYMVFMNKDINQNLKTGNVVKMNINLIV